MTTTFQSAELVRDELVTLFTNNGSWQSVYGYMPALDEHQGKRYWLMVRRRGTAQTMEGTFVNPTEYRFVIVSFTLAYDDNASPVWTSALAEDKADELNREVRQTIRDNIGGGTNYDLLRFEAGFSDMRDTVVEGIPYIIESVGVIARLNKGSK